MKKIFAYLTLGFTTLTTYAATPLWMRDIQISPDGTETRSLLQGRHLQSFRKRRYGHTAHHAGILRIVSRMVAGRQTDSVCQRQARKFRRIRNAVRWRCGTTPDHQLGRRNPFRIHARRQVYPFLRRHTGPAGSALFPSSAVTELYKVPATGGTHEQVLGTPAEALCFDKTGDMFFYQDQKGFEDQWRKHHTSSITRDIWMYDCRTEKHTNLTRHAGEDRNPVLSPDGQTPCTS